MSARIRYAAALLLGGATLFQRIIMATAKFDPFALGEVEAAAVVLDCDDLPSDMTQGGELLFLQPISCDSAKVVRFDGEGAIRAFHDLNTTNVHFVVHEGASLKMKAEQAVNIRRDEGSTSMPLLFVEGEVLFEVGGWTPAHANGTMNDAAGVILLRESGSLEVDAEASIHYTANAITVANLAVHQEIEDKGDEKATQPDIESDHTLSRADQDKGDEKATQPDIESDHTLSRADQDKGDEKATQPDIESEQSGDSTPPWPLRTSPWVSSSPPAEAATPRWPLRNVDPTERLGVPRSAGLIERLARKRPLLPGPNMVEPRFSLKIGETLSGSEVLFSKDMKARLWLSPDGSVFFARKRPLSYIHKLMPSDPGRVKDVERMRRARKEEEEEENQAEMKAKKKTQRGWFSWGSRHPKTCEIARKHAGEVCMTVDHHGCVETTVDGLRVSYKCGVYRFQWVNRFWRKKSPEYEVRLPNDGVEVTRNDRYIWGIPAKDLE